MKQQTIKHSTSLKGIGLHTGQLVNLSFHPAPPNSGYQFKRIDIDSAPTMKADVGLVVSTQRGTTLEKANVVLHTVEHVLAACVGLSIDNVLIEVDGEEIPIMDGSSKAFVEALKEAGIEEQDVEREYIEIEEPIQFKDEETGTEFIALPADDYQVTVMIDYESSILPRQYASINSISEFEAEIAPARTFVFLRELEQLIDAGLIKGGDIDNAIVLVDKLMSQEELDALAVKLNRPSVEVQREGVLNNLTLHYNNEPARHKLLDVIGDFALAGKRIKGRIIATKPGHTSNVKFAKELKKLYLAQRKVKGKPKYDPTIPPLYDVVDLQKMLPHRYPFLLLDKITEISDKHVVGVKNVTFNEEFFQGHFPGDPVMPGVLQIEAMAQTGGILILSTVPDPENWNTYFLKITNAKFKHKVVPGDVLVLKLELLTPIRRGICHMKGTGYVGNKIVSEGELIAQISRRKP